MKLSRTTFCALTLISVYAHVFAHPVQDAIRDMREPSRISAAYFMEGKMISYALAKNEARFVSERDKGYTRMTTYLGGRPMESWSTPQGSYVYAQGVLRKLGAQERQGADQERMENRLLTEILRKPEEFQDTGMRRLLDGSAARSWLARVQFQNQPRWVEVYLNPLKNQLRGYALQAKHPLRESQTERVVLYRDYRKVNGIEVAFGQREYYDGKLFSEMQVTKLETRSRNNLAAVWNLLKSRPSYLGKLPVELPLVKRNMLATTQVELISAKGKMMATMLVDTGASTTILLPHVSRRLDLKSEGELGARPIGADLRLQSAQIQSLRLGTARVVNRWVAVGDLGILGMALGVDGILGSDVLGLFRTTFDFQRNVLILRDTRAPAPPVPSHAVTLPLDNMLGNPAFRVWIEPKKSGWLILDTGARFTVLPNRMISAELREKSPRITPAAGAGGISAFLKGARLPELWIHDIEKGLKVDSVAVLFSDNPNQGILPGTDLGVVGMNILRRYRMTLDYQEGIAIFEPQSYGGDREGDVGIRLNFSRSEAEIMSLVPLSPALGAGLRRGDRLIKIDDRLTENVKPAEAQGWLRGPEGSKVRLTIQRGEETKELELTRETLIM